ncbi:hypothetical protein A2U01_0039229, partial [Trifolium medium]|nr:hypothetical protein [Trifolium medium]
MHGRCKHIDVRYHFLRDLTKDNIIELVHCRSEEQLADILTKPLKLDTFCRLREGLGMRDLCALSDAEPGEALCNLAWSSEACLVLV